MGAILSNLRNTVIAGFVVLVLMVVIVANVTGEGMPGGHAYYTFVMRFLHVVCGTMWIGLLYYFNFVQIPNMPNIPDDQKPQTNEQGVIIKWVIQSPLLALRAM